uniref:NADH-cytochrome b5 reductase n=1 Tax=Nephromyces sp. MMRI TaxID=2496275 RepID=A0A3Q8UBN3_9APIC|nr:NADH-dependent fumarate reductase [Nephromyces sp. MMRI]AZL94383.1 NADH-dependent fumarate reductase [Nephromyces sp. MMRI]
MKTFFTENLNLIFTISASLFFGTLSYWWFSKKKNSSGTRKNFLDGSRQSFKLVSKTVESNDSYLFKFSFDDSLNLGLPLGKHIKFFSPNQYGRIPGEWNGSPSPDTEEIMRKYTPISYNTVGYAIFVIKIYRKDVHPTFYDGGKMSQYLESLSIGDDLAIEGPIGGIEYKGNGDFLYKDNIHHFDKIGLIAGGTGISPNYQLISSILNDPSDNTQINLLYGSKTEDDILLRKELDSLHEQFPNQFKVFYTLDSPPEKWEHFSGFITADMISSSLPPPSQNPIIILCGPPPMKKFACLPNLKLLNYNENFIWHF